MELLYHLILAKNYPNHSLKIFLHADNFIKKKKKNEYLMKIK